MQWLIRTLKPAILALLLPLCLSAQQQKVVPSMGAQVFIEPGQSAEDVDRWFEILKENGFSSCRIRMFESYMKDAQGEWDFGLFDRAFAAAQKYDIDIFATVFPATDFTDVGGMKLPRDQEHWLSVKKYIKAMVEHYRDHPSLHSWVLINEPGLGYVPDTPFTQAARDSWNDTSATVQPKGNTYRVFNFDQRRFLMDLNTDFLKMLAIEIRQHDQKTQLHVNNHNIFQLVDEYDFPSWMPFLNTLGASMHPSWHFRYFDRSDFTLAVAANCDIIKSGAGDKPFWVTELQGGNNTYSGYDPICPTKEEITQWLWTSIGTGAEGIIFWSLNARAVGLEAGEWALITNQNTNSDRLDAAAEVAAKINNYETLFANAKPVTPTTHVLYLRESQWAEKELHVGANKYEGRNWGAAMKSAIAYYQTCLELGIPTDLREAAEFDWSKDSYKGETIIMANQSAISKLNWDQLKSFVAKGGQLLMEGLSGYYDETLYNRFMDSNTYSPFLGAELSEYKVISDTFGLSVNRRKMTAHLWRGELSPVAGAQIISHSGNKNFGVINRYGEGRVVWIPSLLGLGAQLTDRRLWLIFCRKT